MFTTHQTVRGQQECDFSILGRQMNPDTRAKEYLPRRTSSSMESETRGMGSFILCFGLLCRHTVSNSITTEIGLPLENWCLNGGQFFDLRREYSENLLSKDVFCTPAGHRVAKRRLFYTFMSRTPSLESRAIHPIEKRTCVGSFLHLQNPDEFEEGVHIKTLFPEFIYWHCFCSKSQKRPVLV